MLQRSANAKNGRYANLEAAQAALGRSAASCPMPQATTGLEALKESSHELIHSESLSSDWVTKSA